LPLIQGVRLRREMKKIQKNIITVLLITLVFYGCKSSSKNQNIESKNQKFSNAALNQPQLSKKACSIIQNLGLDSNSAFLLNPPTTDAIPYSEDFETVTIPPPKGMSDGFTHTITIDHKNNLYWISCTGGIAGIFEKYGPIEFKE
jgi:hypothetical protein